MSEEATTTTTTVTEGPAAAGGMLGFFLNVACSLGVFGVVVLLTHRLKVNETTTTTPAVAVWKRHAMYWGIAGLIVLALPYSISVYIFDELTLALVACLLPVYESVYAVCTPDEDDDTYWLRYWTVGGIFYVTTQLVYKAISTDVGDEYWLKFAIFFNFWLFLPTTKGAELIDEKFTQPYIGPKLRPMLSKMNNVIDSLIQMCTNLSHLYLVWFFFILLPASLKRLIAVAVGTVYPFVSSVHAISTEEFEDDAFWLTYWSCYGILFIAMDLLETWMGWVPGFYSLVIAAEVYLMLPMFGGAEKIFRKVLVPMFRLEEFLMLRDAFFVKKQVFRNLDADRSAAMREAIAQLFTQESLSKDGKDDLLASYAGILKKKKSNASDEPTETSNLV